MPEFATECPNGEWTQPTLGEALAPLSKTGLKKDAPRSLAALSLLHEMYPPLVRAGRVSTPIVLGDQMVCIDYSSQPVTFGELPWSRIDFWENLTIGDKLRNALSEGEKTGRNQCVSRYTSLLHMSGRPRGVRGCPFVFTSTHRGDATPARRVPSPI